MTPAYLEELAERADPQRLWQLNPFAQMELKPSLRMQLDTAVALRRYASHLAELERARKAGMSLCITPLSPNGTAHMAIVAPPKHQRLIEQHKGPAA